MIRDLFFAVLLTLAAGSVSLLGESGCAAAQAALTAQETVCASDVLSKESSAASALGAPPQVAKDVKAACQIADALDPTLSAIEAAWISKHVPSTDAALGDARHD